MPLEEAFRYYGTERGAVSNYVNAFAVQSRAHTLPFDVQAIAGEISVPTIVIHSEKALAPQLAQAFFERIRSPKQIHWLRSEGQIDFYDDRGLVKQAADTATRFFQGIPAA
jgi:uncharacterized protein